MKKNRIVFLLLLFITCNNFSFAQYADMGTGALRNQVWWFDWNGVDISDGSQKTFITEDNLNVTVTFSAVSGHVLVPDIMNTYVGSVLHLLYDFQDSTIKPALHTTRTDLNSYFTISVVAARDGISVPFIFVAADAEGSSTTEFTTLTTNGSNWTTLEFFRNSSQNTNPLTGCGTQIVSFTNTYGGAPEVGQNPILATEAGATGNLTVSTSFERLGTTGGMAIAFGIFSPIDRGDLPASFGYAQHRVLYSNQNGCNFLPPMPSISLDQSLKIGAIPGDADPTYYTDDNAYDAADEDGITAFPDYSRSGAYALTIPVTNTTGSDAFLTGWFDYNGNGTFENTEAVTATVANNAQSVDLTWTGVPLTMPVGNNYKYGFRFRIASSLNDVSNATGFAKDGEVEDYLITFPPCIKGSEVNISICAGESYAGYSSSGTYKDTFALASNCDSIRTLNLTVTNKPVPYLGNDAVLCSGDSLVLSPGQFTAYLWQDASAISSFIVKQQGIYSVTVTNNCGSATDEIIITEHSCEIRFPGAFTPNKDGKNDVFKILNAYNLQDYYLAIYNRWGKRIFETRNYAQGWDGTYDGKQVNTGSYVWYCSYKRSDVPKFSKGTVVVLR